MKVAIFQYVGTYGGGLVFVGKNKQTLENYKNKSDYEFLGTGNVPDFLVNWDTSKVNDGYKDSWDYTFIE